MDLQEAEQKLLDSGRICYEIDFFDAKPSVILLNEAKVALIRQDLERKGIKVSFNTAFEEKCRKEWIECQKLSKDEEVTAVRLK